MTQKKQIVIYRWQNSKKTELFICTFTYGGKCLLHMRKHVLLTPANYKIGRDCNWQFHTHANSFGYNDRYRSRNPTLVQQRCAPRVRSYPRKKVRRGHECGPRLVSVWFYALGSEHGEWETYDYHRYLHFSRRAKAAFRQEAALPI